MKTIIEMNELVQGVLGDQQVSPGIAMRPMAFTITAPVDEGVLLFHNMTKELLLLDEEEIKAYRGEGGPAETRDYLIRHWFLVPEEHDDCSLSDEIREIARAFNAGKETGKIKRVTILTTTDCNARCYYCFEKNYKVETMTDETAHRAAQYLIRNHDPNERLKIAWFGGEPLFNSRVIDIICGELRDANVDFYSGFTTNAYLFDPETVDKAVRDWHTEIAQIAIDGTEEIYNRTKSYIYRDDPSPFQTVLGNIKNLLKAGVLVHIRLNSNPANIEDLEKLAAFLKDELRGLGKFSITSFRLYQLLPRCAKGEMESFRLREAALNKWLHGEGLENPNTADLKSPIPVNRCAADSRAAIVILTDGSLTKCQHLGMGPNVGHIDSDDFDEAAFAEWCTLKKREPLCSRCINYPTCFWLVHCEPQQHNLCTPIALQENELAVLFRMRSVYRSWLAAKGSEV